MSKSVELKPSNGAAAARVVRAEKLPATDSGYAWVIVGVAAVVFMLSVGVFRSQTVFLEPARDMYNVSHGMMTLMSTGVFITSQLLTLPGNVMSEWLGPRVNVIAAGVCGILCFVICAFAPIYPVYFVSYMLFQGAAFALCYSPVVVTVNRYFHVYRPLASSIALGGVSVGTMIIPNVLRWLLKLIGFRWALLVAGACVAVTIPIAFLIRPITMEQLHLIEAKRKEEEAAKKAKVANERSEGEALELAASRKDTDESKKEEADPEAITSEPKVVTSDEPNGADKNDLEASEKLLAPGGQAGAGPSQPMPVVQVQESKEEPNKPKPSKLAAAFAYFKHMPPLFKNPTYLLHALHFAVIMTVDNIFMSITFDSFLKDMQTSGGLVFTSRTAFAIANFVGRFASGLFLVMPVFIAKCSGGGNQGKGSCFDTVKKYLTVRVLYCGASVFFTIACLLLSIAGFSASPEWSFPLVFVYILVGLSGGCLFSQFPVVLAELVGLPKLAAAHALFMLIQVPVTSLKFISGLIKTGTGTWAVAYILLFIIVIVMTIINSASLLLGSYISRLLCRRSANAAARA